MVRFLLLPFLFSLFFVACSGQSSTAESETTASTATYERLENEAFRTKLAEENIVILDVRTPGEVERGAIEGALNIDFRAPDFQEKIADLDPDKTYLVYCQGGGRSAKACNMMQDMGFSTLYEMKNGYGNWTP